MILLDTHVWIWMCHNDARLSPDLLDLMQMGDENLAVSAISCWEAAKLVERGRLELPLPLRDWMQMAVAPVSVVPLSPEVAVASATLPGDFHRDPADQIIVATSRLYSMPLATMDQRIRSYPFVDLWTGTRIHDR